MKIKKKHRAIKSLGKLEELFAIFDIKSSNLRNYKVCVKIKTWKNISLPLLHFFIALAELQHF